MNGILLSIGGSNIKVGITGSAATSGVNGFLTKCGVAIGAILIALAALKMVIALADENVAERQRAALLFGVGIVFVSIDAVLTTLIGSGINQSSNYHTIARNILEVLGSMASWAGAIMLIFGVFTYIMAITQENTDQVAKSVNSVLVGLGFISLKAICAVLKVKVSSNTTDPTSYVSIITSWLGSIATYGGGILLIMGIFKIIMSVREEDTKARSDAIKLLVVSIALLGFRAVLSRIGL